MDSRVEPVAPSAAVSDSGPVLRGRIQILPETPLPALNTDGADAYAISGTGIVSAQYFALVCHPKALPRTDALSALKDMEHPNILRLLDHGVVPWPAGNDHRYAFVYERPPAAPTFPSLKATREPMNEDQLFRQILQPAANALRELKRRGVTHGSIRPTNFYLRGGSAGTCVLGEYLTVPSGFSQPVLFEPLDRALAQPDGRGPGDLSDDLYALGVTLLFFLLGGNPAEGMTDDEILQEKIERGSYTFLLGSHLVPTNLTEPLRGMLTDDPKLRWSSKDLDAWLNGSRLSARQPTPSKRSARPFLFGNQQFRETRGLAWAFSKNRPEAQRFVENGELDRWLRRSLVDEKTAEHLEAAVHSASSAGRGTTLEERMLARVCIALDPTGPIRYRGESIRIDGFATALAAQFKRGENGQSIADMLSAQLPLFWTSLQQDSKGDQPHYAKLFDGLRAFLDRTSFGFGLERILYDLNPTLPCLSPLLHGVYANSTLEILTRLNQIASSAMDQDPIDRHIAAYILTHHRRMDERLFMLLSPSTDPQRHAVAMLTVLAELQKRHGPAELPGLASWLTKRLEPAIQSLHGRSLQKQVRTDIAKAAATGNLSLLLGLVDDNETFQKDQDDFIAAKHVYEQMGREIDLMTRRAMDKSKAALSIGKNTAAVIAGIVASIVTALSVLLKGFGS